MFKIMQGDRFFIPIMLTYTDGTPVSGGDLGDIEVMFGSIRKSLVKGDGDYKEPVGEFVVDFSQEETFNLPACRQEIQVRVKSKDGHVIGETVEMVVVRESISKAVI